MNMIDEIKRTWAIRYLVKDGPTIEGAIECAIREYDARSKVETLKQMVSRFLVWRLPKDFAPDGAITFNKKYFLIGGGESTREYGDPFWPVGTNLFSAEQAKQMFKYVCETQPPEHTTEENYQHFLSYSGLAHSEQIRVAYYHGAGDSVPALSAPPKERA